MCMRSEPVKISIAREALNGEPSKARDYYRGLMDGYTGGMAISDINNNPTYYQGWNEGYELALMWGEAEDTSMDSVYLTPYDLGFHLFCQGESRDSNPFDSGTGNHVSWDQGWLDAREEERELLVAIGAELPEHPSEVPTPFYL